MRSIIVQCVEYLHHVSLHATVIEQSEVAEASTISTSTIRLYLLSITMSGKMIDNLKNVLLAHK